jgi:seryl-tRNA synthetase
MTSSVDLPVAVPDVLADEVLKRLPFVSEGLVASRLADGGRRIEFDLAPGFEPRAAEIGALIADVARKVCGNHRPGMWRTLAARADLPGAFERDPHPLLEAAGELRRFGAGRWALGPKVTALVAALDRRVLEIARQYNAPAHAFPSLIGADVLDRCRYFRNFPTSLGLVSHLREDHERIQAFARSARAEDGHLVFDPASLSTVECLLSPAVCFHWYARLADGALADPAVITAVGKCFRYESSLMGGLERLWDFTMREVIFVGSAEFVRGQRPVLVDACVALLGELGLAYEIATATDPFFADAYAAQAAYQQGFELKFELLLPLPYSGRKLAVGSVNYHQDFFGRSFNISAGDDPAHTGCLAFGLERFALAFLAQHGPEERHWPDAVAADVRRGATGGAA